MIITVADVVSTETTCVGIVIDCRDSPDSPYPNGGRNYLTVYVSVDGKIRAATCVNTRYENYEILRRLYPDLQIEIIKTSQRYDYMMISDPRVGPEWLIPTENQ